ncbi:hypothetical protein LWI29_015943 [Acer saccharum]|uniref:Uncharacterized protein n=1 Tax=Acer saccharum TaxID=4024 RepID=A0AA39RW49_ACESA|nr:hypothetical protein LWI29_015943 [Acer saccharum]
MPSSSFLPQETLPSPYQCHHNVRPHSGLDEDDLGLYGESDEVDEIDGVRVVLGLSLQLMERRRWMILLVFICLFSFSCGRDYGTEKMDDIVGVYLLQVSQEKERKEKEKKEKEKKKEIEIGFKREYL